MRRSSWRSPDERAGDMARAGIEPATPRFSVAGNQRAAIRLVCLGKFSSRRRRISAPNPPRLSWAAHSARSAGVNPNWRSHRSNRPTPVTATRGRGDRGQRARPGTVIGYPANFDRREAVERNRVGRQHDVMSDFAWPRFTQPRTERRMRQPRRGPRMARDERFSVPVRVHAGPGTRTGARS
jgi:hypothetical protein